MRKCRRSRFCLEGTPPCVVKSLADIFYPLTFPPHQTPPPALPVEMRAGRDQVAALRLPGWTHKYRDGTGGFSQCH